MLHWVEGKLLIYPDSEPLIYGHYWFDWEDHRRTIGHTTRWPPRRRTESLTTRGGIMSGWNFTTLAYLWEYRNGAIMAGADQLDALPPGERQRSLQELTQRTTAMVQALDDGWLVNAAFYMVDDIYKSFFRFTRFTDGVLDYLAGTAAVVMAELHRRGMVLHYVVDATQGTANLETMLRYVPALFEAAGFAVIGPQIAALGVLQHIDTDVPVSITAIQDRRDEGHVLADRLITEWHAERRSSAYLNLDLDDDSPALSVDAALAVRGEPRTIVVFRNLPPSEGSEVQWTPPPDVTLPPAVMALLPPRQ